MSDVQRLTTSLPCCIVVGWDRTCDQPAHWQVVTDDAPDAPICDEHIQRMAEMNSDNETFLAPALADIRAREEK